MYIRCIFEVFIDYVCFFEIEFGYMLCERVSGLCLGEWVFFLRWCEWLFEMLISEEWIYEEYDGIGVCSYGYDE